MSIRLQILCSLGVMFLLSCVMFVPTWSTYVDQRADGQTVGLTDWLRDQVHQIANDALSQARRNKGGDASNQAASFLARLDALEKAETVLTKGGEFSSGANRFDIQVPEAEASALYADGNRLIKALAADI